MNNKAIDKLSIELWHQIFDNLVTNVRDLFELAKVSKTLNSAANSHLGWKRLLESAGVELPLDGDYKGTVMQNLDKFCFWCNRPISSKIIQLTYSTTRACSGCAFRFQVFTRSKEIIYQFQQTYEPFKNFINEDKVQNFIIEGKGDAKDIVRHHPERKAHILQLTEEFRTLGYKFDFEIGLFKHYIETGRNWMAAKFLARMFCHNSSEEQARTERLTNALIAEFGFENIEKFKSLKVWEHYVAIGNRSAKEMVDLLRQHVFDNPETEEERRNLILNRFADIGLGSEFEDLPICQDFITNAVGNITDIADSAFGHLWAVKNGHTVPDSYDFSVIENDAMLWELSERWAEELFAKLVVQDTSGKITFNLPRFDSSENAAPRVLWLELELNYMRLLSVEMLKRRNHGKFSSNSKYYSFPEYLDAEFGEGTAKNLCHFFRYKNLDFHGFDYDELAFNVGLTLHAVIHQGEVSNIDL